MANQELERRNEVVKKIVRHLEDSERVEAAEEIDLLVSIITQADRPMTCIDTPDLEFILGMFADYLRK